MDSSGRRADRRSCSASRSEPRGAHEDRVSPESPYFYDYLTVAELLDLAGRLFGVPANLRRSAPTS